MQNYSGFLMIVPFYILFLRMLTQVCGGKGRDFGIIVVESSNPTGVKFLCLQGTSTYIKLFKTRKRWLRPNMTENGYM